MNFSRLAALCLPLLLATMLRPLPLEAAPAIPMDDAGSFGSAAGARAAMERARGTQDAVPALPLSRAAGGSALRGPIDETRYVLGPGDVLEVTVSAGSTLPQRLTVTPEGELLLSGIGSVKVAGVTLRDAKRLVLDRLEESYRNVEVAVSLVALRRMEIHVTGAVHAPGTYAGTAMDVVSAMIDAAGGEAPGASRREIRLRAREGGERRVDLVRYERLGDTEWNPPILDGDVIFVPYAKTEIHVAGAVEAPGAYEFVAGDTIESLLAIAGGLRRDARRDSLELRRFADDRLAMERVLPLSGGTMDLTLRDGDQVYVRFSDEFRDPQSVTIEGQVRFPGPFGIAEGNDRVSDIVARAGGITEDASLSEAQLIRSVAAEAPDLEFERLKTVPIQDMSKAEYAYFKGKSRERKGLVVLDFERLLAGDGTEDRLLRDGDRIVIPERRETITVSGTVSFPGLIPYEPGRKGGYYIGLAGGYASSADRGKARVIRGHNGEWESMGDAGEIVPGDEIWVPERPERDWWQFTQDAVRFAASVATVYLVIDRATSN
ncbi:SLBB domain-containing protein [bacterium]|nr:SLBB domain-containing protein [bacterium]